MYIRTRILIFLMWSWVKCDIQSADPQNGLLNTTTGMFHRQLKQMLANNNSFLSLTPTHLSQCTKENKPVDIEVKRLTIQYSQPQAYPVEQQRPNNGSVSGGLTCWFNVSTSDDYVVQVQFPEQTCSQDNFLSLLMQVNDTSEVLGRRTGCEDFRSPLLMDWVSRRRFVIFAIVVHDLHVPYVIKVKAVAVSSDAKSWLQYKYLSPKTGLLQSPGWNPTAGVTNPPFAGSSIDSTVHIQMQTDHIMMMSFLFIALSFQDRLQLRLCMRKPKPRESGTFVETGVTNWPGCFRKDQSTPMDPFLFPYRQDPVLIVYQMKADGAPYPGFRLLFTFHQISSTPVLTSEGQWNCSVNTWPSFRPHLACNVVTQCLDGRDEDEEECGYPRCGPHGGGDGFQVNGRCYSLWFRKYQHDDVPNAEQHCQRKGSQLASLSTVSEYKAVARVMWTHQQFPVTVGLYSAFVNAPSIYKRTPIWADKTVAYPVHYKPAPHFHLPFCGELLAEDPNRKEFQDLHKSPHTWTNVIHLVAFTSTYQIIRKAFLCEYDTQNAPSPSPTPAVTVITMPDLKVKEDSARLTVCPSNHTVHDYLACDPLSHCWALQQTLSFGHSPESWDIPSSLTCPVRAMTSLPPSYSCRTGGQRVPYTLVCDYRQDCVDNSDEDFCVHKPCLPGHVPCGTDKQCYSVTNQCDGQKDCINGDDEASCSAIDLCTRTRFESLNRQPPPAPPAVVDFMKACHTILAPNQTHSARPFLCPKTHYQCPNGYCLPVFTRCNGLYDCPEWQDEARCEHYTCPGYFRCRGSSICLHPSHLCDGMYHCPQSDDESLCDLRCPNDCTCHGLAFTCPRRFPADQYPDLRYLKARDSGLKMEQLTSNVMLVYLNLASCNVSGIGIIFPNLVTLDVSDNNIISINTIVRDMVNLKALIIANNPLSNFLYRDVSQQNVLNDDPVEAFPHVQDVYLSGISLPTISDRIGNLFPGVRSLNVSGCGTHRVTEHSLQLMIQLQTLDMTGCPMEDIQKGIFKNLFQLRAVYGDNYKLCCDAASLEGLSPNDCHAPMDEISSCGDLLRSNVYRGVLAMFASLAMMGNLVSVVFRVMAMKRGGSQGFSVFVVHLCVSDFLMGLYLAVVGVADRMYQNRYVWKDVSWRHSTVCQLAGFLSLLSSEVSAFIVSLITLDRFLAVHFPFSFLHFQHTHAQLASGACWMVGILLAAVPLLPATAHWNFYSQTGICIPLPVTRKQFAGQQYAFTIMIVLNFIFFIIIALGQSAIFYSVRANQMSGTKTGQRAQDSDIARRLFTIAMSDFLCWFPIGLLGLLASQDVPVSGEVNVAMAIFVLPLNSAINPFLYTLNMLLEKRRRAKEDKLVKLIQSQS